MAKRFDRLDNQAPVQKQLDASNVDVSRSAFDFSFVHSGNTLPYMLTPVDCFDVVPNEDISMSIADLVEFRNPTVRPLLNGFRVYFHAYYNRLVDLWEGAKNFLDTGRSGKISLNRPRLIYSVASGDRIVNACTPLSLLAFLGLPVERFQVSTSGSGMRTPLRQFQTSIHSPSGSQASNISQLVANSPDYFPADCAFAYQRNWRDFYCNKNLLQENKFWFPDNEDHFILSYSCSEAVCINYENEDFSRTGGNYRVNQQMSNLLGKDYSSFLFSDSSTPEPNNPASVSASSQSDMVIKSPNLSGIKFRQFRGDRFTTALPFPDLIRGDIPALSSNGTFTLDLSGFTVNIPSQNLEADLYDSSGNLLHSSEDSYGVRAINPFDKNSNRVIFDRIGAYENSSIDNYESVDYSQLRTRSVSASVTGTATASTSNIFRLSQNDIRALETFTVFRERMARTNGDYNEMIKAQYGVNPHVHSREGTYIGGFYQDFNMSVVTQTSESSSDSPLGNRSANMYSNGSGTLGNFHVPDFGWIQIYMSIVSDVMYTQGVPRMFSKQIQTDMYFPIFNNLAPQAILNKELFVSGVTATDNDVFAYEDRYAEYKSRTNRVSGFMSLSHSVAAFDSSRVMARRFSSTPSLNSLFVTGVPENVDYEVFSVVDEPPFDFSVGVSVRRVFPGPYTAIPGALSSKLHA